MVYLEAGAILFGPSTARRSVTQTSVSITTSVTLLAVFGLRFHRKMWFETGHSQTYWMTAIKSD